MAGVERMESVYFLRDRYALEKIVRYAQRNRPANLPTGNALNVAWRGEADRTITNKSAFYYIDKC